MLTAFKFTARQEEAQRVCSGPATHVLLAGGSRSGKTVLHVRNTVMRALKASRSRHAVFRFRRDHVKTSVFMDTFPNVMSMAFAGVPYVANKSDLYVTFPNGSEIWFGGLDDKLRAEKVLGQEYATIFLNECSQIPVESADMAATRLAQRVLGGFGGEAPQLLKRRMFYDCNPPSKAHWTYRRFVLKQQNDNRLPLAKPEEYQYFALNPGDNVEHLGEGYLDTLASLSARQRLRFLEGQWAEATPGALFDDVCIETWRVLDGVIPDMVRIAVAVDPSGSGDIENSGNDSIGIVVVGLGSDGNAYVLEDCTVKAGPATWGSVVVQAYHRHAADVIVGENNFGGAMVEHTIKTAAIGAVKPAYKAVHASRGKSVRAEPFASLYSQGRVRHVGYFRDLEEELCQFSTSGYLGDRSPNHADALIWGLTEIFPALVSGGKARYPVLDPSPGGHLRLVS